MNTRSCQNVAFLDQKEQKASKLISEQLYLNNLPLLKIEEFLLNSVTTVKSFEKCLVPQMQISAKQFFPRYLKNKHKTAM